MSPASSSWSARRRYIRGSTGLSEYRGSYVGESFVAKVSNLAVKSREGTYKASNGTVFAITGADYSRNSQVAELSHYKYSTYVAPYVDFRFLFA